MSVTVEKPPAAEIFAEELRTAGAPAPWAKHANDPATLLDASGVNVMQIDPDVERTDEEVAKLADWVLVAVNTCAGFKAVREET